MKNFKFSYDENSDDLFIYLQNKKSNGAVEIGNFILDFDEKENLVAMQILEASKVLSKMVSRIIELSKIKELKVEIVNFRNMASIRLVITTDVKTEISNIVIPRIKQEEKSPAITTY